MENKSNQNLRTGLFSPFTAYTGDSKRTVCRVRTLERRFTRQELEMFKKRKLTQQQIEEASKIGNEKKRQRVVALIAKGKDFAKAWQQVMKEEIDLDTTTTKAEKQIRAAAKREKAPELSDEDWLDQQCGEKMKLIKADTTKYKSDALLYREVAEARAKFRFAVEVALDRRKEAGPVGFLWGAIDRLVNLAHPREWPICGNCSGKGKSKDGRTCKYCQGAGFVLGQEN